MEKRPNQIYRADSLSKRLSQTPIQYLFLDFLDSFNARSLLSRYDVLDEDDCSQVEQLVFCDQRRMAHAAGEFLALRIIRLSIEASPKKLRKGE